MTKSGHWYDSLLLDSGGFARSVRRRTVGGNFVGVCLCMSYFVFFDSVYKTPGTGPVLKGVFLFFMLQAAVTGFRVRRWMKEILDFLLFQEQGEKVDPEIARIARRKIFNLPYLCAAVTAANWIVSALLVPTLALVFHAGDGQGFLALRMLFGITIAGVATTATVFFNVEGLCRRWLPVFFKEGGIGEVQGMRRLDIRTRLSISLALISLLPSGLIAFVAYNKTRLMVLYGNAVVLESLGAAIVFMLAVCSILVFIISRMISRSIISPVQLMEQAIQQVEQGDLAAKAPLVSNDELGVLAQNFNKMMVVLRDRERMQAMAFELEKGRKIQRDFLPKDLVPIPGWDMGAAFVPAGQVSGDFYDSFMLPGGKVAFVIADVCDKGVGAALFMALFRSLIRVFSLHPGADCQVSPGHGAPVQNALCAVSLTNDYIATVHEENGMFATVFLGILEPETGVLHYVNAGHEPPMVAGPHGLEQTLAPTGPAVGLRPRIPFGHDTVTLAPGQVLFAFTDGVLDARNASGKSFSRERLRGFLRQPPDSAGDLLSRIQAALSAHVGETAQFDDITMFALRRDP